MAQEALGAINIDPGQLHTETIASNILVSRKPQNLIYPVVFREHPVEQDDYYLISRPEWIIEEVADFGPNSMGHEVQMVMSKDKFQTKTKELHTFIGDQSLAKADSAIRRQMTIANNVEYLKNKIELGIEKEAATIMSTSGNYATGHFYNLTGGAEQFDDTNVNSLFRIEQEKQKLLDATGAQESDIIAVVSSNAWPYLRTDADLFSSLTGINGRFTMSREQVAGQLGVRALYVASSRENTASKGLAENLSQLWAANSLWLIVAPENEMDPTTFGRIFLNNNLLEGTRGTNGEIIQTWRDPMYRGGGGLYARFMKSYGLKYTFRDTDDKIVSATWLQNIYDAID